jgi:hypothetical protein
VDKRRAAEKDVCYEQFLPPVLAIGEDLRREPTIWVRPRNRPGVVAEAGRCRAAQRRARSGGALGATAAGHTVMALKRRLERAMIGGDSWAADDRSARMFREPLRGAMARPLI